MSRRSLLTGVLQQTFEGTVAVISTARMFPSNFHATALQNAMGSCLVPLARDMRVVTSYNEHAPPVRQYPLLQQAAPDLAAENQAAQKAMRRLRSLRSECGQIDVRALTGAALLATRTVSH